MIEKTTGTNTRSSAFLIEASVKKVYRIKTVSVRRRLRTADCGPRARGADFQVGGLTRTRKREPTRGVRGHAPPGKFEILFF